MTKGKRTCKILKEIRKQIAAENDIELVVSECTYQGDCLGTCPKCEAEVRYLERELEKRQRLGKAVMISGMALTSMLGMSSCGNNGASTNKASNPQPTDNMEITDDSSDIIVSERPLAGELVADSASSRPACSSFNLEIPDDVADGLPDDISDDDGNMEYYISEGEIVEEFLDVYRITDQMPEFPGGEDEMMKFVQDNVVYPQQAKDAGVEGRVFVSFIVETDGSVSDVKVLHGIGHGCDEAAAEVVQSMPKWKPGLQNGEAVRVRYMLPVSFQLSNPSKN
ncbi:MAG: energy transducer TonB [Bacteroidales bacterium]|nr:energy transducer TonB [Bacteroidales bacterium]